MPSLSKKTKFRRKLRRNKAGKDRKRTEQSKGTTPEFPIHTPEAHANAPKDQLPKSE